MYTKPKQGTNEVCGRKGLDIVERWEMEEEEMRYLYRTAL